MKKSVLTFTEIVTCVIVLSVAAFFFGVSLVSAAEMSTANGVGLNRSVSQGDSGRATISDVSRASSTSADGQTVTHVVRFTISADNGDVYVPTVTTGRGSALVWQNAGVRAVPATIISSATTSGTNYVVREGEGETFEIAYVPTNRSRLSLQAIRYNNESSNRLNTAQFPQTPRSSVTGNPSLPGVTRTPVASTTKDIIYCRNGTERLPEGTERTTITNASGITSVVADARFVCRNNNGVGVWTRVGSLPGNPCVATTTRHTSYAAFALSRAGYPDHATSTDCATRPTSNAARSYHNGVSGLTNQRFTVQPCRFQDRTFNQGAPHPFYGNSTSFVNSLSIVYSCNNGVWEPTPVIKPLPSQSGATGVSNRTDTGTPPTSISGSVRGASTDIFVQMAAVIAAIQEEVNTLSTAK
ncbi:MAG: hypothetical protein ACK4SL_03780 [Candidatus Paceibacteria bacterium]